MGIAEDVESVYNRLKRLKEQEQPPKPRPVTNPFLKHEEKKPEARPKLSRDTIFSGRVERAILKIEGVEKKMRESDMYLNYYNELHQAKKEFLEVLKEAEQQHVEFSERLQSHIEKIRLRYKI